MYISFQMAMLGIKSLNSWGESINISNMFLPSAPIWTLLQVVGFGKGYINGNKK